MRLRASKRSRPAYGPAAAVMRASSPITLMNGRLWRLPASKSFGSCAGVIFTTPVPNFGSAMASAMIGISRSDQAADVTVLPCRC